MFAITVVFEVRAERSEDFSAAVQAQARNSMSDETGCHLFDVCVDPERPGRFFLYELYSDEEAFQQHLRTDHFHDFDQKVGEMVIAKSVERWNKL